MLNIYEGVIKRVLEFGLIISIDNTAGLDLDGILHRSKFPENITDLSIICKEGEKIRVSVNHTRGELISLDLVEFPIDQTLDKTI
jgi:hypothetical protein